MASNEWPNAAAATTCTPRPVVGSSGQSANVGHLRFQGQPQQRYAKDDSISQKTANTVNNTGQSWGHSQNPSPIRTRSPSSGEESDTSSNGLGPKRPHRRPYSPNTSRAWGGRLSRGRRCSLESTDDTSEDEEEDRKMAVLLHGKKTVPHQRTPGARRRDNDSGYDDDEGDGLGEAERSVGRSRRRDESPDNRYRRRRSASRRPGMGNRDRQHYNGGVGRSTSRRRHRSVSRAQSVGRPRQRSAYYDEGGRWCRPVSRPAARRAVTFDSTGRYNNRRQQSRYEEEDNANEDGDDKIASDKSDSSQSRRSRDAKEKNEDANGETFLRHLAWLEENKLGREPRGHIRKTEERPAHNQRHTGEAKLYRDMSTDDLRTSHGGPAWRRRHDSSHDDHGEKEHGHHPKTNRNHREEDRDWRHQSRRQRSPSTSSMSSLSSSSSASSVSSPELRAVSDITDHRSVGKANRFYPHAVERRKYTDDKEMRRLMNHYEEEYNDTDPSRYAHRHRSGRRSLSVPPTRRHHQRDSEYDSRDDHDRHGSRRKRERREHRERESQRPTQQPPAREQQQLQPEQQRDHEVSLLTRELQQHRHSKWGSVAINALKAGTMAALASYDIPGAWIGDKGARVATAVLGAAIVDTYMVKKHPNNINGVRHTAIRQATEYALGKGVTTPFMKRIADRRSMRAAPSPSKAEAKPPAPASSVASAGGE